MKAFLNLLSHPISMLRLLPHLTILAFTKTDAYLLADIARWENVCLEVQSEKSKFLSFIKLMRNFQEFRNIFYYRVGTVGSLFKFLCPPLSSLYIHTEDIGPGLFIQHGFSTIISAKKIGANCWINQQITIGATDKGGQPTIEDNVTIGAGAKILGNVSIGKNSKVGANAVVVKNVPPDVTVVGVPARIVKRNNQRVSKTL